MQLNKITKIYRKDLGTILNYIKEKINRQNQRLQTVMFQQTLETIIQ